MAGLSAREKMVHFFTRKKFEHSLSRFHSGKTSTGIMTLTLPVNFCARSQNRLIQSSTACRATLRDECFTNTFLSHKKMANYISHLNKTLLQYTRG